MMKNSVAEIEFHPKWPVKRIKWYGRTVIRLPGSACASSSAWRFPVRPRGATAALNFRPAPRATRTPHPLHRYTREANGAVLCGFCWQWCGTTRYKLVLDAAPPTDTIAVTRSTYVAHAQHTGLYDACSNYPPPSFHQPESVIQLNVTLLSPSLSTIHAVSTWCLACAAF